MSLNEIPSSREVREAIGKFISTPYVEAYFRRRGILIATNKRDNFGEFCQYLFLEYADYEELHDLATKTVPGQSIAGFEVDLSEKEEENPDLINIIQGWANQHPKRVQELTVKDKSLTGRLKYTRRAPGKYELVGSVSNDVAFEIVPLSGNRWSFQYYPERITDKKQFERMLKEALDGNYASTPQLQGLPNAKRIEFYDCLIQEREFGNWIIDDVVGLKVREPDALPEDEDDFETENDDGQEELEQRALGSIREAILKGENLRTNPFVKHFEDQGYYFQSMSFRLRDKENGLRTAEIMVRFKLRPLGLEISLVDSEQADENTPEDLDFSLSKADQKALLEVLWSRSNSVLRRLQTRNSI